MTNQPDPDAFDPFRTTDPETAARDMPADEFDRWLEERAPLSRSA